MGKFEEYLTNGRVGESVIAEFLKSKGFSVMPVYEIEKHSGKGPQLFCHGKSLVAPDAFVFKGNKAFWMEAKHKTAFSFYRKKGIWTTGIDLRHYTHYCEIDELSPWPIWLLFLHKGGKAKDSPFSESGLFGEKLEILRMKEDHRSLKHGNSGMVYWNKEDLIKIGDYDSKRRQIIQTYGLERA